MENSVVQRPVNILLGITGSVASIKLTELIDQLIQKFAHNVNICVVPTKNALHFAAAHLHEKCTPSLALANDHLTDRLEFIKTSSASSLLKPNVLAFVDEDEWTSWSSRGDPVLHIELRRWADLLVIAPLDANTLAKLSSGMCDNLLTCVVRAWDFSARDGSSNVKKKPVVVCPAMNTCMYEHPFTARQLAVLVNDLGVVLVDAVSKRLMCNDVGVGAMASVDTIVNVCFDLLCQQRSAI
jgi:phosphopantothenoylcysteine decarboxylase